VQNTIETPLPEFFRTAQDLMFGSEIMGGSREDDFYLSPAASVRWKIGEQVERALKNHVADLEGGLRELPKDPDRSCLFKRSL